MLVKLSSLFQCYETHNAPKNATPEYPLCAVELKDFMFAAKDTPTCIRKSNMPNPTQGKNTLDFFPVQNHEKPYPD